MTSSLLLKRSHPIKRETCKSILMIQRLDLMDPLSRMVRWHIKKLVLANVPSNSLLFLNLRKCMPETLGTQWISSVLTFKNLSKANQLKKNLQREYLLVLILILLAPRSFSKWEIFTRRISLILLKKGQKKGKLIHFLLSKDLLKISMNRTSNSRYKTRENFQKNKYSS